MKVKTTGNPNNPFDGNLYDDNATRQIATNGYHEGVVVDGYVFDNLHPNGIELEKWLKGIGNHNETVGKPKFFGDF